MQYSSFENFPVYEKGLNLLIQVYHLTERFPKDERFNLISDTRRSANSILHNIAEGFGRYGAREKTRFYKISRGSGYEILSQFIVSSKLDYISMEIQNEISHGYREIIEELDKIIRTLESKGG